MKALYESILSSTNTGKQKVLKEKIEKWCENNISGRYLLENNENPEIVPSIVIKLKTSRIPAKSKSGIIQHEKYLNFLLIAIENDVLFTVEQFIDRYLGTSLFFDKDHVIKLIIDNAGRWSPILKFNKRNKEWIFMK